MENITTDSKDFSCETNNYIEGNPSENNFFHELKKKKKIKKLKKISQKNLKRNS